MSKIIKMRFRYRADAVAFIQTNNLSMDCLKGTNGNWIVEYEV